MNRCAMGVIRSVAFDLRQAARALEVLPKPDKEELAAMIGHDACKYLGELDFYAGALTGASMELSQFRNGLS